ncbi:MAG TPA: hypothetical protein VI837_10375 [Blastocatellia bacterium]|nr:hypothetical protein [Blastocatellia bacterium]
MVIRRISVIVVYAFGRIPLPGGIEDKIQFKLAGKPGVKVQFILSKGKVDRVTYLEDKPGKMIFAIGTPKD